MTAKDKSYQTLCLALESLIGEEPDALANLSNSAALLFHSMESINWAGFYLYKDGQLVLGPFQGKPACIRIPMGKGVCGTSASTGKPLIVAEVHRFAGHIACDAESASEAVVPLFKAGRLVGVLDVDSPLQSRFDESDRAGLEQYAAILSAAVHWEDLL